MLAPDSSGFNLYFPNASDTHRRPALGAARTIHDGAGAAHHRRQLFSAEVRRDRLERLGRAVQSAGCDHETIDITLARGVPFVWTTCVGIKPQINCGSVTLYDTNGTLISTTTGHFTNSAFAFDYQGRSFGIFAADNTSFTVTGGLIEAELSAQTTIWFMACSPPIRISPSSHNLPMPG